jgi:beta-galactosidase
MLDGERYSCELWSDWIELEGAEPIAVFADGWLAGRPAVTRNGSAWYAGAQLDAAAMDALVAKLLVESGVTSALAAPPGVEAVRREGEGRSFLFLLNHNAREAKVEIGSVFRDLLSDQECAGTVTLEPFGVAVLRAEAARAP